ncbi:hypothetical protein SAMN04488498_101208 [Mesorhizobium albiziae]|uniref:Phasin protein n=1 Tax=Neomesorhizobium albiziae TaxID=335020 RepID=A0A1I3V8E0_9HYPH|nr:hypothetical protein [Mesorhizobium albiziae]GLS28665.1 hypothetical protein GCM10007937_03720 [Mesorhizobium albiziae]SFJ90487.1 hypothetical protein SAMN04488498_101208 [Mesorhizobium albiziae]
MTKRRSRRATRETATIAGNLMLAPMVAAMRLPLMASESRGDNPFGIETQRAIAEKNAAIAEGILAAQMSMIQSAWRFWPEVLSGRTPSVLNGVAAERSMNAALKPASRRVKANFKRLARSPQG